MQISFYRPNKSNKGYACSFWTSSKDGYLFATIIRQSGWNHETGNGTFKKSVNDPNQFVNVKLTATEAAAIIDCIERNRPLSTVHDTGELFKTITFTPWMTPVPAGEKSVSIPKGFSFAVGVSAKGASETSKNSFFIGLTLPEGRLLKEFLLHYIHDSFNQSFSKEKISTLQAESDKEVDVESPSEEITEPTQKYDTDSLVDL